MPMRRITVLIVAFLIICLTPSAALADITEYEREELARMLYGEDRSDDWSVDGVMRKAAVVQVALNRLDAGYGNELFGGANAIVRRSQFRGYERSNPAEGWAIDIVNLVCDGWELEQAGEENYWRVLPTHYLYFGSTDSSVNRFRDQYDCRVATYWDFEDVPEDVWWIWNEYLNGREVVD